MSKNIESSYSPRLLVVEDDPDLREALVDTLVLESMSVEEASSAEQALAILEKDAEFDLIVSDVNMGVMSGHDLLRNVRSQFAHIPVLLITAYASISESVKAMKEGAVDYLVKPFEPSVLVDTVSKFASSRPAALDAPIAQAPSSQQLLSLASRVAQSESTVMLVGESGTGKEVLAQYVHNQSPRSDKPFVAINCAAIPENMLEAMLFGYEKGAFTGAHSVSPGKFEQANGGTILLDEITEMDLGLQAKLLRVLQEREVERLGGRKSIKLDVRVIATSNRDMRLEVSEGKFREDLYFRLSVLPLQWAPLRDRKEDILPLANSLLTKHAKKQRRVGISLDPGAVNALLNYAWPGNVRELDNVMQRALILQPGSTISEADLGLQIVNVYSEKPSLVDAASGPAVPSSLSIPAAAPVASEALSAMPNEVYSAGVAETAELPNEESLDGAAQLGSDMKKHEFEIIVKTLKQENGSKKNTAERLGISPRTLRYKLARLRDEGYNLDAIPA